MNLDLIWISVYPSVVGSAVAGSAVVEHYLYHPANHPYPVVIGLSYSVEGLLTLPYLPVAF